MNRKKNHQIKFLPIIMQQYFIMSLYMPYKYLKKESAKNGSTKAARYFSKLLDRKIIVKSCL